MLVTREFSFDSAHFLTRYHGQCEHLHGHTYRLWVTVEGEVQENGMVIDFVILKKIVKEQVLDHFDHRCLNDFFENPTTEIVAQDIWQRLKNLPDLLKAELENPNLPEEIKRLLKDGEGKKELNQKVHLYEIRLSETPSSMVIYRGE